MAIPDFVAPGFLPPGVHDASLEDIAARFGHENDRRTELFGKLEQFVGLAKQFALFTAFFVDGSFVTDKPSPGDIDGVLELPRADFARLLVHPKALQLLDRAAVKKTYEVHLFIEPPPSPMGAFFQRMRPEEAIVRGVQPDACRGILRVSL